MPLNISRRSFLRTLGYAGLAGSNQCFGIVPSGTQIEACTRNLKLIFDALVRFRASQGDWPLRLSELSGRYLASENLVCPVCTERRVFGIRNKSLKESTSSDPETVYKWELNVVQKSPGFETRTWRDLKLRQKESPVGNAVPIVRCDQHIINGTETHLNLTFAGDVFSSSIDWEEEFADLFPPIYLTSPKLVFGDVRPIPARVPTRPSAATVSQIDLGPTATALPTDPWQTGNRLDSFINLLEERDARGLFIHNGVDFDVQALVQLDGRKASDDEIGRSQSYYRTNPITFVLKQPASRLHFLGGVIFPSPVGAEVGGLRIRFATGREQQVPWRYGAEVRDGWHDQETGKEAGSMAWSGMIPEEQPTSLPKRTGPLKVYHLVVDSERPGEKIESIEFYSSATQADPAKRYPSGPFLLGLTLES